MNKHRPLWRDMKRWLLCLFAFFMLETAFIVTPTQVYGQTFVTGVAELGVTAWKKAKLAAEWVKNHAAVQTIINTATTLSNVFTSVFEDTEETLSSDTRAALYANLVNAKVEEKIAQARIDARTLDVLDGAVISALLEVAPPKHDYLCKKIGVNKAGLTTQGFEKEVSRMAAEAISARYRCPTCDGMGPDYIGREQGQRCSRGYGNAIDGAAAACQGKTAGGKSLADADISPIDGGQIYQMPKIVSKAYVDPVTGTSITVSVPDPENEQQQLWVAAWDNIFLLAGSRPSPRHGKGMKTPVGKVERAMFNHCTASQNALVKQCTDLLAYYTRPYCAELSELCKEQQEKCLAATGFLDLAPYQECGKASGSIASWQGLSPYEEDQIDQSVCKSNQHYSDMVQAGAFYDGLTGSSDLCSMSWSKWREVVDKKHANCTAAVDGMQRLESCWANVAATGGQGGSASLEEPSLVAPDVAASYRSAQSKARVYKAEGVSYSASKNVLLLKAAEQELSPQAVNP